MRIRGRTIGIDYGERRIGLAISDETGTIAMPWKQIDVRGADDAVRRVRDLALESGAVCLVVGIPLNMSGGSGPMAEKAESFAGALEKAAGLPVCRWDERLSTVQAEKTLLEGDLSRRKRRNARDKLAAQMILQSFLDSMDAGNEL